MISKQNEKEDKFPRITDLLGLSKEETKEIRVPLEKAAEKLKHSGETGNINLRVGKKGEYEHWNLKLDHSSSSVNQNVPKHDDKNPYLEVHVEKEIADRILNGDISMIHAISKGKITLKGDFLFAQRVYKKLLKKMKKEKGG